MNDRFKFRVWDKINEIWVKNFSIDEQGYVEGFYNPPQAMNRRLVLLQCTGLKDKNGKLIYEGDILGGSYGNLYIHYCDNCKQFQLKANDYGCMACEGDIHWYELVESENENELEVIGNIYENKELLDERN